MEFYEEEVIDPLDYEPAVFELSGDKIALFEKRGFFPTPSGLIDDTYYQIKKEIKQCTHLRERLSMQELINKSFDEMERVLFMKDSVEGMPVKFYRDYVGIRGSFGRNRRFYDVDPLCLEPFIARYVRAINRCGMETFFSCDGWHNRPNKSRELVILFRDRYSCIWHKALCEKYNIGKFCRWKHNIEGPDPFVRIILPRYDERKIQVYNGVLSAADIFVQKVDLLKGLKESFLSNKLVLNIDALSDHEVEERMREFLVDQL